MAWIEGHEWLLIAGLAGVIVLIVIIRYAGGFKAKATLPGGSLEFEGTGRAKEAAAPSPAPPRERLPAGVNVTGDRSVGISGRAEGATIITGDRDHDGRRNA
jgi:hypothetical protein